MTLGVVLFVAHAAWCIRDHRSAAALHLHLRARRRSCCCCCRCSRASATRSTAPGSGSTSAGFSFQPGEVAKVLLVLAFAGYLVRHRDALALAGSPGAVRRPAPRPRPRPDPGDVADLAGDPGLPARPRLLAALLRPLPGDALRRHRASRLAAGRRHALRRRRATVAYLVGHVSTCASTCGCTRSTTTAARAPATAATRSSSRCSGWAGAACSAGASATATRGGSPSPSPTSSSPRSARSSG